jgi:hypothetical protein
MADLAFKKIGDSYYASLEGGVVLEFSQLREHAEGMTTDVSATDTMTGSTHWARVTLASAVSRNTFLKSAAEAGIPRASTGEFALACHMVVKAERQGTPAEPLEPTQPSPQNWLVPGWIPRGETTVLYGDGGVGKSLFCLALALSGLTGKSVGDSLVWRMAALKAVLYLDWESHKADHEGRWWGLTRPVVETPPVGLFYKPMHRPLTELIGSVRADVARLGVDLVVADSLAPASGAEPEGSDAAVRTMNALRSLAPASRLVTAHVSKAAADQAKGPVRPFGSVYVRNLARSTVHAAAEEQVSQDESVITYSHTKANSGSLQRPTALRYLFDEQGHVLIRRFEPDLSRVGLSTRILAALKGGAQEIGTLAEQLEESESAIKKTLQRLENRDKVVRVIGTTVGRGHKQAWGLEDKSGHANRDI